MLEYIKMGAVENRFLQAKMEEEIKAVLDTIVLKD